MKNNRKTCRLVEKGWKNRRVSVGIDPGSSNCAYGIIESSLKSIGTPLYRIKARGLFENPLSSIKKDCANEKFEKFTYEIFYDLFELWMPDETVIERFMARPTKNILVGELANISIGAIIGTAMCFGKGNKLNLITPSTWKNAYNRISPVLLETTYKICRTTPHELDACLMAIWSQDIYYGRPPFTSISTVPKLNSFLDRLEDEELGHIHRRNKKRDEVM